MTRRRWAGFLVESEIWQKQSEGGFYRLIQDAFRRLLTTPAGT
jgi:hypothetical protein